MRKDLRIKICSFFTAAVVSLSTFFSSAFNFVVFASVAGVIEAIGAIANIYDFLQVVGDLVDKGYISLHAPAEECYAFWSEVIVYSGMDMSAFEEYYTFVATNGADSTLYDKYPGLGTAYGIYQTGVSGGFNPARLCDMMFNDDGTCKYSAPEDAGVSHTVDESGKVTYKVDAKWLKLHAEDYNNRYRPMPNEEQYIISWQNSNSKKTGTDSKYFAENAPVYTYTSGTWGDRRWNEAYILPFFYNDNDSRGCFYGKYFFHFYSSKEDDSTVMIHSDVYSFVDNSKLDTSSSSVVWDITNYPYLGYQLDGSFLALYAYKSSSGLFLGTVGTRECTRLSYFNSGMIYSLDSSSIELSSLLNYVSPNFTPATNSYDDWGYIVSNKPFENMLNQTSIDFDRIPDNYYITIGGDTIYNYPISDPSGNTTTINNYITNNYTITNDDKDPSGGDTTNNVWNIDFPDFIANITTSIETAITNVFVADIDVINNYNQEMQDALNKKLPFLNDFGDIYKSLFVDIVDNNFVYAGDIKPTYHASSGGGTAEAGGTGESSGTIREEGALIYPRWRFDINFFGKDVTLTILDFSMYAEPLYYVRIVVCAFIYILYFVNLMRYLPTLIGNVMDMTSSVSAVSKLSRKDGDEK